VILATAATIIASQAVITGAFSLARQAIHLGLLPRLEIRFTSETNTGQIYLPSVNTVLFIGVLALIFFFRSSESLATAYGISVTGAMVVTTLLAFQFVRVVWHWSLLTALAALLPLLALECVFLGANMLKIHDGGYVPVMIAGTLMVLMWTWKKGTLLLKQRAARHDIPLAQFVGSIERASNHAPVDVPGTAVFLTSFPDLTPSVLLHNLKHNHALHAQNVILTIKTMPRPTVSESERYVIQSISKRFIKLELRFGFMDTQNVSKALSLCRRDGFKFDIMSTSFYIGREFWHAALAGQAFHRDVVFRHRPQRPLPSPEQPRGGNRRADRHLGRAKKLAARARERVNRSRSASAAYAPRLQRAAVLRNRGRRRLHPDDASSPDPCSGS
jgi:KUP system potassium uptake protein